MMRLRSSRSVAKRLLLLLAIGVALSAQTGAWAARPGPSHGVRAGLHVRPARLAVSYRHFPHHPHHWRPYYRPYYRPYWYAYSSWYTWGWGGFWLGPPPRSVYVLAQPTPATVETDVRPKKAEVKLDGVIVGQSRDYNGTWDRLKVVPGRHTIEFVAPGYKTLEMQIDLESGGHVRFDQKLQKGEGRDARSIELPAEPPEEPMSVTTQASPALPSGFMSIRATPGDAVIYLDGEFLARADELARLHGALPLAPGRHVLDVIRPGYVSQRVEVDVESDRRSTVEVELRSE